MMGMSPASMGLNNCPAAREPDKYEYSWSWDLGKQAEVHWNPGTATGSMPWIEGGQGGDAVFVNAIPSSAHTGGWEVKRKPSDWVNTKDVDVGIKPGDDSYISNAASSGDYGYAVGRIPAKATAWTGGNEWSRSMAGYANNVQTINGEGGNRYISVVITFLPGHYIGSTKKLQVGDPQYMEFMTPAFINGIPHWNWDGTPTSHGVQAGGELSVESTAAGRAKKHSTGEGFILPTDLGKIMTLTYDMGWSEKFLTMSSTDIDEISWYDEHNIQNGNVGFVLHGFIIGSTVPYIRSLPIRTTKGGEGRHSLAAHGPG